MNDDDSSRFQQAITQPFTVVPDDELKIAA